MYNVTTSCVTKLQEIRGSTLLMPCYLQRIMYAIIKRLTDGTRSVISIGQVYAAAPDSQGSICMKGNTDRLTMPYQ